MCQSPVASLAAAGGASPAALSLQGVSARQCSGLGCGRPRQGGFTLIELICVIILLGLLAATVLPKYINFKSSAQHAVFEQTAASFGTSVVLFHSKVLASNPTYPALVAGYPLSFSHTGYPIGSGRHPSYPSVPFYGVACEQLWAGLLQSPPTISTFWSAMGNAKALSTAWGVLPQQGTGVCTYVHVDSFKASGNPTPTFDYNVLTGTVTTVWRSL